MNNFLKLNLFSFLYGLFIFIEIELMENVYRLERITHWFNIKFSAVAAILLFLFFTIFIFLITSKKLISKKFSYFLTVLWIPYYVVLNFIAFYLIPLADKGDDPPPVMGLLLIMVFICYPFYIALINYLSKIKASS